MGDGSFTPFLTPIIRDGETSNSVQYIGGMPDAEPATPELHNLSFIPHPSHRPDIVAVRIRLLAALGTPAYYVAVGRRA
jgi:hypothetical protein